MNYEIELKRWCPGAYATGTSLQVWIQNADGICISRAYAYRLAGAAAPALAWKSAYERYTGIDREAQ